MIYAAHQSQVVHWPSIVFSFNKARRTSAYPALFERESVIRMRAFKVRAVPRRFGASN